MICLNIASFFSLNPAISPAVDEIAADSSRYSSSYHNDSMSMRFMNIHVLVGSAQVLSHDELSWPEVHQRSWELALRPG